MEAGGIQKAKRHFCSLWRTLTTIRTSYLSMDPKASMQFTAGAIMVHPSVYMTIVVALVICIFLTTASTVTATWGRPTNFPPAILMALLRRRVFSRVHPPSRWMDMKFSTSRRFSYTRREYACVLSNIKLSLSYFLVCMFFILLLFACCCFFFFNETHS